MKLYAFLNRSIHKDIQENKKSVISCGYANGYVAIPKEHPFYGQDYDFINKFVDVHGGLTFSKSMHSVFKDFDWANIRCINCDFEDIPEDYWVIGFDTLHSGDDESLDAIWCTYETIRLMYQLKEKAKKRNRKKKK